MLLRISWSCLLLLPAVLVTGTWHPFFARRVGYRSRGQSFSNQYRKFPRPGGNGGMVPNSNAQPRPGSGTSGSSNVQKFGPPTLGPVCTRYGRRCLSNAACIFREKRCKCPDEKPEGDGLIECAEKGKVICSVQADPKVSTWNKATAPVNLPCWYTVTKFLAPLYPKPSYSAYRWCKLEVQALNNLTEDGLFFVTAVKVDLWLVGYVSNKYSLHTDSRKKFEVNFHMARQSIYTRKDPWEVWTKQPTWWKSGSVVKTFSDKFERLTCWEAADRFAVLHIPQCGVKLKYRPYGKWQPQCLVPGLVVTVTKSDHIKFCRPSFLPICQTLAMEDGPDKFKKDAIRWKLGNPGQVALFYTLLQRDIFFPTGKNPVFEDKCRTVRRHIQHKYCQDDRYLAIRLCGPILNRRKRFIQCLRKPHLAMQVFEQCVAWACFGSAGGKTSACQSYLESIRWYGCSPTKLMNIIGCDDTVRKFYRDKVYNPSPFISSIIGY